MEYLTIKLLCGSKALNQHLGSAGVGLLQACACMRVDSSTWTTADIFNTATNAQSSSLQSEQRFFCPLDFILFEHLYPCDWIPINL